MFKAQTRAIVQRNMENMINEAAEEVVDILATKYGFDAAEAKEHLGVTMLAEQEHWRQHNGMTTEGAKLRTMHGVSGSTPRKRSRTETGRTGRGRSHDEHYPHELR